MAQTAQFPSPDFCRQLAAKFKTLVVRGQLYRDPEISLSEIAKRLDVNRYYLSRAINTECGMNFSSYMNELRLKEAVKLLKDPKRKDKAIDSVAKRAGFNDRKTFFRVCKAATGLSPAAVRQTYRQHA